MGLPGSGVRIRFIRDFQNPDGSVSYTKGSEFLVDAATADALLLAGVVVTVPTTTTEHPTRSHLLDEE